MVEDAAPTAAVEQLPLAPAAAAEPTEANPAPDEAEQPMEDSIGLEGSHGSAPLAEVEDAPKDPVPVLDMKDFSAGQTETLGAAPDPITYAAAPAQAPEPSAPPSYDMPEALHASSSRPAPSTTTTPATSRGPAAEKWGSARTGACHKCGAQIKDPTRVMVCHTCGCRYHLFDCGLRIHTAGLKSSTTDTDCPRCTALCECGGGTISCHTSAQRQKRKLLAATAAERRKGQATTFLYEQVSAEGQATDASQLLKLDINGLLAAAARLGVDGSNESNLMMLASGQQGDAPGAHRQGDDADGAAGQHQRHALLYAQQQRGAAQARGGGRGRHRAPPHQAAQGAGQPPQRRRRFLYGKSDVTGPDSADEAEEEAPVPAAVAPPRGDGPGKKEAAAAAVCAQMYLMQTEMFVMKARLGRLEAENAQLRSEGTGGNKKGGRGWGSEARFSGDSQHA